MNVSCIIPCYNEGDRIQDVLECLSEAALDEIICVDDGSTDDTSQMIKQGHPKVKLIRHEKNAGKSEAVHSGLREACGEYILLLDGDQVFHAVYEIENAVSAIAHSDADMVIMRRTKGLAHCAMLRVTTILSGQRVLRRDDLLDVFASRQPTGYQLEVAINQYMIQTGKKVVWVPNSSIHCHAHQKLCVQELLRNEKVKYREIVAQVGVTGLLRQMIFFGRARYR